MQEIERIMSKNHRKNYRHQTIMNWIKRAGLRVLMDGLYTERWFWKRKEAHYRI